MLHSYKINISIRVLFKIIGRCNRKIGRIIKIDRIYNTNLLFEIICDRFSGTEGQRPIPVQEDTGALVRERTVRNQRNMSQTISHRPTDDQATNGAPNKENVPGTEKEDNEGDVASCTLRKPGKPLVGGLTCFEAGQNEGKSSFC